MESTKSYYLYELQERYSGQDWMSVIPKTYSIDGNGTMPRVLKSYYEEVCDNTDYSKEYLTIESLENGNIIYWSSGDSGFTKTISASTDNGQTWTAYTSSTGGTTLATLNVGDKVLLKGENSQYATTISLNVKKCNYFTSAGQFNAYGNIMSLISGDSFVNADELTARYTFAALFSGATGLASAENLVLPATTLAESCYYSMFYGCTSLTTAPELPATTLADRCYWSMFEDCTSLMTAPELPATTLAVHCYLQMFQDCPSLTTSPALPATTLANECYQTMFYNCTSLITAPSLPATTLAEGCYSGMFYGCTSLTTAPVLSATTLADWCYNNMFYGCTSLTSAPSVLPATTLAEWCYTSMFSNCTSLTTAPVLPATSLAVACYHSMFFGCTNLNYIKCLTTDISANSCTVNWVVGVASSGTFVKASSMNDWTTGSAGIPTGWTVQNV